MAGRGRRGRARFGLPGTVLEFHEEHGRLIATKAADPDPVDAVYGILDREATSDELLVALRGPTPGT